MQLNYQFPLYLTEEEKQKIDLAMCNVGKFYRTCFNNFWFNKGQTYLELKKKEFCYQFGIGTKQANSLIKEAQAKVVMWQEALCYAQQVKEIKLKQLKKREEKIINLIQLHFNKLNKKTSFNFKEKRKVMAKIKRLKGKLWSIHRKQEKIQAYLAKNHTITFGSKQTQKALSKGKVNLKFWRDKRNNFIYGLGEGDVKFGNNTIKLLSPEQLQIEVAHLEKILVKTRLRKNTLHLMDITKRTARVIKKTIRGKIKYYLQITVDLEDKNKKQQDQEQIIKKEIKIGGTDLNQGFVSFYSPNIWENYPYLNKGNKQQTKENLRKIIKNFMQYVDVLRIENLDFKKTKAKSLKSTTTLGKQYNVMLNKLPYKMFKDLVMVEAYKAGVKVELINPKNSSKKALELGYDRHLGVAKIIAEGNL